MQAFDINEVSMKGETGYRYKLIKQLAAGGMSTVWLAIQLGEQGFERQVVIKQIRSGTLSDDKLTRMLLDEARLIASLDHPNIVKFLDLLRFPGGLSLVMEFIDGEALYTIIRTLTKQNKVMPLSIACSLMIQACEGLHYAHTARDVHGGPLRVVHRDLDTNNMMLSRDGLLKIVDFGIAKSTKQRELTLPGMIKGKLSFIAPESFSGKKIDRRADIYTIGLALFQLVTGRCPIEIDKNASLKTNVHLICHKPLPPPSEYNRALPRELDNIIGCAVQKDRRKRYQSVHEFSEALSAFAKKRAGLVGRSQISDWFADNFRTESESARTPLRMITKAILTGRRVSDLYGVLLGTSTSSRRRKTSSSPRVIPFPNQSSKCDSERDESDFSYLRSAASGFGRRLTSNWSTTIAKLKSNISSCRRYRWAVWAALLIATGSMALVIGRDMVWPPAPQGGGAGTIAIQDNLFLSSTPGEAEVLIDGQSIGNTGKTVFGIWLKPNEKHRVSLRKAGYSDFDVNVWGAEHGSHRIEAVLNSGRYVETPPRPVGISEVSPTKTKATGVRKKPGPTSPRKPLQDSAKGRSASVNKKSPAPRTRNQKGLDVAREERNPDAAKSSQTSEDNTKPEGQKELPEAAKTITDKKNTGTEDDKPTTQKETTSTTKPDLMQKNPYD